MSTLLCTLGMSWPIVIEAFRKPGATYDRVYILTSDDTEKVRTDALEAYFRDRPEVDFRITRVAGFTQLNTTAEHHLFEEALYRWYLVATKQDDTIHACIAGGFKTMSSTMQQAARLFGAEEVFHVLAPDTPEMRQPTTALLEEYVSAGRIHYISLGAEPGWSQLRSLSTEDFALHPVSTSGLTTRVEAPGLQLRDAATVLLNSARHLSHSIQDIASLPFVSLGTLSPEKRAWLEAPLDSVADSAWLRALPKVELHCHLGGFATHGSLLERVRAAATCSVTSVPPPEPPQDWPLSKAPIKLNEYMHLGDASGSALLKDPGCLRVQCQLLYHHLVGDNVHYAEIRCSPNNYANVAAGRSAWVVLSEIRQYFQECMEADRSANRPYCHVNLIIIATRKNSGDRSDISRHLALAITAAQHWSDPSGCQIVGVDLAGFEHPDTRAALFQTDFEPVHRVGLAVTIHAGENDDAEGIWQAVFKLNARRIGHALHLWQSPDLLRAVADRGIGIEMCPYANYQIHGYSPMAENKYGHPATSYPLLDYLKAGIKVSANTDNIGISAATLSDNLMLLATLCPGIRRLDVLHLQAHALATAFTSVATRHTLQQTFERDLHRILS